MQSSRPISPLLPKSTAGGRRVNPARPNPGYSRENSPPLHPNVQIHPPSSPSPSLLKKAPSPMASVRHPRERPSGDAPPAPDVDPSDSFVKVVVRIRPVSGHAKEGDRIVKKVSSDSLSVGDRTFTFDSILGPKTTQEDVFKLVGVPLVRNALAGFNASILSYGQTGSGKTFTMWGPPNAMVDGHSANGYQGIVPRIFRMLFSEIQRKKEHSEEEHIKYQCRCSFLEIHNEQINDLLDTTQRNLQIRDDSKNGFYVENLTDEYVATAEDVTQILVKGLSNRKVGATSTNSKGSRSHIVFTCIIESWSKGTSSKYFSSSKTSRLNLIDLAGSDRDHLDAVGRQSVKEGRYVKQSLSKLGRVVSILANVGHSGKDRNVPFKDSCLTHLLKETLGGNSKVTLICAISPECRTGTLSTLRFGERAKHIRNQAVINEITEDDVNGLSDQIRQLKEELLKAKTSEGNSMCNTGGYFRGHNARESLNHLRVSLNRSLILPCIDNESEEEVDIDEEDVRELCDQLSNLPSSSEDTLIKDDSENKDSMSFGPSEETRYEVHPEIPDSKSLNNASGIPFKSAQVSQDSPDIVRGDELQDSSRKSGLSITPCRQLPVLDNPTVCASPKIEKNLKKSLNNVSRCLAGKNLASESPKSYLDEGLLSKCDVIRSSLQSSKVSPTESLAASIHRGLQIIGYHQRSSATEKPILGLSFEHLASISRQPVDKSDAAVQTISEDGNTAESFLCSACKNVDVMGYRRIDDKSNLQIVAIDDAGIPEALRQDANKILANAIKRQMELEDLCTEQAATIKQLNSVVDQCKREHEHSSVLEQNQEAGILCLQGLVDGVNPMNELMNKAHTPLAVQQELLNDNRKTTLDMSEKEALLGENQGLQNQLKSYKDSSTSEYLLQHVRNGSTVDIHSPHKREELEKERQRWTESESRWISLTEELRLDLESNRRLAEKKDAELSLEKKCTAELDDALQRAILGHARIIEHYAELQEKYDSLLGRHRKVMEGIADVKKAARRAGTKGRGSAFVDSLAAELSALRIEKERERAYLREQNRNLKVQLRDTAEAVHAAGELLVRLREAEEAVALTEEKCARAEQEAERLTKQMEKLKRKHAMEMVTMKHYLAESRLPESALEPFYRHEAESAEDNNRASARDDDDQAWRSAFRPCYQ